MKAVSIEEAWDVLRQRGYENQFASGWQMIHPDRPFVGRALTAAYLPGRPDLVEPIMRTGKQEGRIGPSNSWPIDMLQKGDVYIADGCGKVADGTLIGDNLGNAIYAKTGTGVVFDAGARDLDGLKKIEGFNAFVRGWDPSFLKNMVLSSINRPIRIGLGDRAAGRRHPGPTRRRDRHPASPGRGGRRHRRDRRPQGRIRAPPAPRGRLYPRADRRPWTAPIKADFFKWLERGPTSRRSPTRRSRSTCRVGSAGDLGPARGRRTKRSRPGEDLADATADDRVFAGLHHPDADRQGVPRARGHLDTGLALAELLDHLRRADADAPGCPIGCAGAARRWRSGARRSRS